MIQLKKILPDGLYKKTIAYCDVTGIKLDQLLQESIKDYLEKDRIIGEWVNDELLRNKAS